MVEKADLRRVPAFADLPDEQLDWFLGNSQELHVAAGDTYIRQGDPAEWMFVILEGQFEWRGDIGGDTVTYPSKAGDVTGILPFSRMKRFSVTFRALTAGRLLKFPASLVPGTCPENAGIDRSAWWGTCPTGFEKPRASNSSGTGWRRWASFPRGSPMN